MSEAVKSCYFVPIGPKDHERVVWTVDSIQTYSPQSRIYLMPDGVDPAILDFPSARKPNVRVCPSAFPSKGHWGEILLTLLRTMREATRDPSVDPDCAFYKIDCDAVLVRHGMEERTLRLFRSRPDAGQLGQCHSNLTGARLSNLGWENFFRKSLGLHGLKLFLTERDPLRSHSLGRRLAAWREFRAVVAEARANGYMWGEFAIGGCFALRAEVVRRMDRRGWIDSNCFQLLPKVGDDVALPVFVYAVGFSEMDDCGDDGLFAVYGKEPIVHPLDLKKRGHYVIHPCKYGVTRWEPHLSEKALVEALMQ